MCFMQLFYRVVLCGPSKSALRCYTFPFINFYYVLQSEVVQINEKQKPTATQPLIMSSLGLLALLTFFVSFNLMHTKHFLVKTEDNSETEPMPKEEVEAVVKAIPNQNSSGQFGKDYYDDDYYCFSGASTVQTRRGDIKKRHQR